MFCVKCGRPTEGDKIVCDECAAKEAAKKQPAPVAEEKPAPIVEEPKAPEVPVVDAPAPAEDAPAPAEEAPAPAAPVPPTPQAPQVNPSFTVNTNVTEPPKKKKKGAVGLIIAAVLLVAAIVAAVLCWPMISGLFNNKDGEDATTEATQPEAMSGSVVETAGAVYGAVLENLQNAPTSGEYTIALNASEDAISLLESAMFDQDSGVDISWLKSLALNASADVGGSDYGVNMGVGLNGTDVLTVSVFMDVAEGILYMGIPELSDTYLSVDMEETVGADVSVMTTMMNAPAEMNANLAKELPDQAAFEAMLEKYIDLVIAEIEEGETETETFTLNGISQELTATTRKLDQEDLATLFTAVLEEAKDDETVKQIITAFCNYTNEYNKMTAELSGYDYIDEVDPDEIIAAIPELIEDLKDVDTEDDSYITLVTYTNAAGKLCGVTLKDPDGNMVVDFVSVSDDSGSALQIVLPEDTQITGHSSNDKAEYTLVVDDASMLTVCTEKTDAGMLITLAPSAALLEEMSYEYSVLGMLSSASPELQLKLGKDSLDVELWLNGKMFVGIGLAADTETSYKPSKPGNAVSATDEEALENWVIGLDFADVLQSLKDAGVPEEYVNALKTVTDQLPTLIQGGSQDVEQPNAENALVPGEDVSTAPVEGAA